MWNISAHRAQPQLHTRCFLSTVPRSLLGNQHWMTKSLREEGEKFVYYLTYLLCRYQVPNKLVRYSRQEQPDGTGYTGGSHHCCRVQMVQDTGYTGGSHHSCRVQMVQDTQVGAITVAAYRWYRIHRWEPSLLSPKDGTGYTGGSHHCCRVQMVQDTQVGAINAAAYRWYRIHSWEPSMLPHTDGTGYTGGSHHCCRVQMVQDTQVGAITAVA